MATLHPTADQFDRLVEPLDDTTRLVADALAALDDDWAVYIRPHVGQDVPDVIAVHEHHGVVTVEVAGGERHRQADEVVAAARRHRSTIYDQLFAFPGDARDPGSAVRAVVVSPGSSRIEAEATLAALTDSSASDDVAIWGDDDLADVAATCAAPAGATPPSPSSIRRLRRELVVGGVQPPPFASVRLSEPAQAIAMNPTGERLRGVSGPAGSGKTFALTARAARLAAEHKRVLVLCFNLTLANRLRSLTAARCAELGAPATSVTCTSFHTFCGRVVDDAARAGIEAAEPSRGTWPERMVAKTVDVFERGFERRYDAVLVDEGQDFRLEWWNLLRRHVVRPDGEMLLVSDPMVDLGGKQIWSDPDVVSSAGFAHPWTELSASYRMAPTLVEATNAFATEHVADVDGLPTVADDQERVVGSIVGASRVWRNVDRVADLGHEVGRQVVELLSSRPGLLARDVVYLCEYHHDGLAAAAVIEAAGYPVHHVYSRDPDARHLRKGRFWPGADAVKGCTVHSFKGWESPVVVLGVGVEERSRRLAYASMTRVSSTLGVDAALVVVNADPRIAGYQPTFELGAPLAATS